MNTDLVYILSINGGSSSIKFALYQIDEPPMRLLYGMNLNEKILNHSIYMKHDHEN